MTHSNNELPIIIGQSGPLNGQRWVLGKDLTIGRDITCDIVIVDRQVSRFHARISRQNNDVLLEDLSSKNGTFYQGEKLLEPIVVEDGDFIQIAMVQKFVYLSSDSTMPMDIETIPHLSSQTQLLLDEQTRQVWIGGNEIIPPLSVSQFKLLQLLHVNQGAVVSRLDLIFYVWGEEEAIGVSEQALDALVRRLRERLSEFSDDHNYIVTIRGHGLKLENPP
ncbi:MAG: FHA domain-containing protein [Anaerolineaceae bacterium]|nr:FHA domain-containing protein [Anaerolineaceae bacterium]